MKPETEADLAEIVKGLDGPIRVSGGGTRGISGDHPVLDTTGMTGITLYEPGALTMVAQAGTSVAEIEAALTDQNQRLAFEPMDHRGLLATDGDPTIGGVFAGNISGPRRIQAGAARDFLLGVRFVNGLGVAIKNGGRVMKNVTGYDLVKLMAGSWGTLGVLSEVSFKVLPRAEMEATVNIGDLDLKAAVSVMSAALGSPYDVTGAAYDPDSRTAQIRVEGFADSVRYRAGRLIDELEQFGACRIDEGTEGVWSAIRDVAVFQDAPGDVWRISVKPTDALQVETLIGAEARLQFDWGGGLVWALVESGTDVRANLSDLSGHYTLVRAAPEAIDRFGRFSKPAEPLRKLEEGLRRQFDPRGFLNPGLMG
ncbi:FAD-binding protein [Primorskyibacter sp. S87]|uniref:FAD-binding protein n=1 Tax=Primorskyibacter sp. S87 TaxID=3415126 RepID=UPI003C7A8B61